MTFKSRYRIFPDQHGSHLYSVVQNVQIAVATPNAPRTRNFEALVDSGASRCVFHADIAAVLGLDLRRGVQEMTTGISGPQAVWLHDVTLYIPGGPVRIKAAFQENLPLAGLLGMKGFFEHFIITFDPGAQECSLERLYSF